MKTTTYTGIFISDDGHTYELTVNCNGYLQAFFLLTADAIRSARHYQLSSITNTDNNKSVKVGDIIKISQLILTDDVGKS